MKTQMNEKKMIASTSFGYRLVTSFYNNIFPKKKI
jgi:hypothetical protein